MSPSWGSCRWVGCQSRRSVTFSLLKQSRQVTPNRFGWTSCNSILARARAGIPAKLGRRFSSRTFANGRTGFGRRFRRLSSPRAWERFSHPPCCWDPYASGRSTFRRVGPATSVICISGGLQPSRPSSAVWFSPEPSGCPRAMLRANPTLANNALAVKCTKPPIWCCGNWGFLPWTPVWSSRATPSSSVDLCRRSRRRSSTGD